MFADTVPSDQPLGDPCSEHLVKGIVVVLVEQVWMLKSKIKINYVVICLVGQNYLFINTQNIDNKNVKCQNVDTQNVKSQNDDSMINDHNIDNSKH